MIHEASPDLDGISVLTSESHTGLLELVIDFAGRHWPTLFMNGTQVRHL